MSSKEAEWVAVSESGNPIESGTYIVHSIQEGYLTGSVSTRVFYEDMGWSLKTKGRVTHYKEFNPNFFK